MYIKRNSIFLIDREKDKPDGKLRYRIKWNGNTVAFNVGFRVEFNKWSSETQRVKNGTTHGKRKTPASVINKEITRFSELSESMFSDYEQRGTIPTADEFRSMFNALNGKTSAPVKSIYDVFDEFTMQMGTTNQWTKATFAKFASLHNHLTNFAPDLSFAQLDENGLLEFVKYLQRDLDMRNSSVAKMIKLLKWFLRWATAKGYNVETAFQAFSPKLKTSEKKVIFLDWDELMTVYNFEIPGNKGYLARVRDVFCFCCFTSLRYSDVANLKRSDVFDNYISITTIKTADSLKIELNDYSRAILDKYKNEQYSNDAALPVISNQRMNEYLKELGELCGIDKPVTVTYYKGNERHDEVYPKYALLGTHAGRRTFICNALMMGIPAQVVMKWTGHSDYKAMKPYIDVADAVKADAMSLFNKKSPAVKNGD